MSEMHIKTLEQVLGQQMETDGKGTYPVTLDGVPLLLRFVEAEELFCCILKSDTHKHRRDCPHVAAGCQRFAF